MKFRLGVSRVGPGLDFHVAIGAIPALAWSSHSGGSVDYVNQRWHEYTGLSPEESYGRGWKTAIYPDDFATLTEKWEVLDDANAGQACEVRLRRSDGVFRWFSFRREPLRDATGAVTDGTEPQSILTMLSKRKHYTPQKNGRWRWLPMGQASGN